jgi:hypothetical protein
MRLYVYCLNLTPMQADKRREFSGPLLGGGRRLMAPMRDGGTVKAPHESPSPSSHHLA